MQEKLEQLSALVDNELDEISAHRLITELDEDGVLRGYWQRHFLIRECIQNQMGSIASSDLASGIRTRLDSESGQVSTSDKQRSRHHVRFAFAASMMIAAIFGWQYLKPATQDIASLALSSAPSPQSQIQKPAFLPAPSLLAEADPKQEASQDPLRSRLEEYMVNHAELASRNRMQGVMPYARAVGHDMSR